jgi:hypothetical protein
MGRKRSYERQMHKPIPLLNLLDLNVTGVIIEGYLR